MSAFAIDAANTKRQTKLPVRKREAEREEEQGSEGGVAVASRRIPLLSPAPQLKGCSKSLLRVVRLVAARRRLYSPLPPPALPTPVSCFIKYISFNLRRLSGASSRTIGDNCSIILPFQKGKQGRIDGTCTEWFKNGIALNNIMRSDRVY